MVGERLSVDGAIVTGVKLVAVSRTLVGNVGVTLDIIFGVFVFVIVGVVVSNIFVDPVGVGPLVNTLVDVVNNDFDVAVFVVSTTTVELDSPVRAVGLVTLPVVIGVWTVVYTLVVGVVVSTVPILVVVIDSG